LEVEVNQEPKKLLYVLKTGVMKPYYDFIWAGESS